VRSSATRAAGSGSMGRADTTARRPATCSRARWGRSSGGNSSWPPGRGRSGGSCCVLGAGGRGHLRSAPATARSGPGPRRSPSPPSPGCRAAGPAPGAGPGAHACWLPPGAAAVHR
jgi:hypothetical protein